jgi:hypothetical protein
MRSKVHTEASIRTYTGRYVDILNPKAKDIDIADIAHALSQLCRFTGHTKEFYSVAQHCWHVSYEVPAIFALDGLLHDASEAYMADMSRPLKHAPEMSKYRAAEKAITKVIQGHFGLGQEPKEVKDIDRRMCATEMRDLMDAVYDWGVDQEPLSLHILGWGSVSAERLFLGRFYELTGRNKRVDSLSALR